MSRTCNNRIVAAAKAFTLIEAVIAIAILALALVPLFSFCGSAVNNISQAETVYLRQHELTQAAEFYLLTGPGETISADFIDTERFSARCELQEADYESLLTTRSVNGSKLKPLLIELYDKETDHKETTRLDLITTTGGPI